MDAFKLKSRPMRMAVSTPKRKIYSVGDLFVLSVWQVRQSLRYVSTPSMNVGPVCMSGVMKRGMDHVDASMSFIEELPRWFAKATICDT